MSTHGSTMHSECLTRTSR